MDRREFLAAGLGVAATAALPALVPAAIPEPAAVAQPTSKGPLELGTRYSGGGWRFHLFQVVNVWRYGTVGVAAYQAVPWCWSLAYRDWHLAGEDGITNRSYAAAVENLVVEGLLAVARLKSGFAQGRHLLSDSQPWRQDWKQKEALAKFILRQRFRARAEFSLALRNFLILNGDLLTVALTRMDTPALRQEFQAINSAESLRRFNESIGLNYAV